MSDDITNRGVRGFLSAEIISLFVVGGVTWGALNASVDALESEVVTVRAEIKEKTRIDSQINERLAVMATNQEHFKREIEKMLDLLEEG